jgi:hypothetical protein
MADIAMIRTLWWVARARIADAKRTEGRSVGASALEWAIISAILVTAAILIGNAVYSRVQESSSKLDECSEAVC